MIIAATDYVGIATLITAAGAVVGTLFTIWYGRHTTKELRTFNDKSVGEQTSAATSARFAEIPVADRTDSQVQHLLDVPPEGRVKPTEAVQGNPTPPDSGTATDLP